MSRSRIVRIVAASAATTVGALALSTVAAVGTAATPLADGTSTTTPCVPSATVVCTDTLTGWQ